MIPLDDQGLTLRFPAIGPERSFDKKMSAQNRISVTEILYFVWNYLFSSFFFGGGGISTIE